MLGERRARNKNDTNFSHQTPGSRSESQIPEFSYLFETPESETEQLEEQKN